MKQYPSIPSWRDTPTQPVCYAFDKLDGSNIRVEWSPKQGFYKWGSRKRMLGNEDEQLGEAISLFNDKYADAMEERFKERHWKKLGVRNFVVFMEYIGPNSFAGVHDGVDMDVVVFDINPTPRGFMPPKDFIEFMNDLHYPTMVYHGPFDAMFIDEVQRNALEYPLTEGVVAKGVNDRKLWMAKVKTDEWADKVRALKLIGVDT